MAISSAVEHTLTAAYAAARMRERGDGIMWAAALRQSYVLAGHMRGNKAAPAATSQTARVSYIANNELRQFFFRYARARDISASNRSLLASEAATCERPSAVI
jgi:hypothetical protein